MTNKTIKYRGKVTDVGEEELTIILFRSRGGDIIGQTPKANFPSAGYKVGQIFDYECTRSRTEVQVRYSLVPVRELTDAEFSMLEKEVKKSLSGINLNKI